MNETMITHRIQQGTDAWLELRSNYHTASEANAMMGTSSYMSRTQLLDQKKTGKSPEPSSYEKHLFALGHKMEDMARPIVENIIDDDLFQLVASRGNLLASFDGITIMNDICFEHKMWNEKLAETVRAGNVPDSHVWQLEQQLYVADAEKILFVVSDGTAENMVHCWYESDPVKRKQLLLGWAKFEKDLETHQVGQVDKLTGHTPDDLLSLSIQVQGSVLASNLDIFTANAVKTIETIKTELSTDQDFADAENSVKWCKSTETALTTAKQNILSQSQDINAVMEALDSISDKVREKRLTLEKLVKTQKEQIKRSEIALGYQEINEYVKSLEIKPFRQIPCSLENAIKGKKTLSKIKDTITAEVTRVKAEIDLLVAQIDEGIDYIEANTHGYEFLFRDKQVLAENYSGEYLAEEVKRIIDDFTERSAAETKAKAQAEADRLIKQAERQKQEKAKQETQLVLDNGPELDEFLSRDTVISAMELNNMLQFDHRSLVEHLGLNIQTEYSKPQVIEILSGMMNHIDAIRSNLLK